MNSINGGQFSKREKMQQLILSVLVSIGSRPQVNQEFLLHVLYSIDFNHYELHELSVTGDRYCKTETGAEAKVFEGALQELIQMEHVIQVSKSLQTGLSYHKLLPTVSTKHGVFTEVEVQTIQEVLASLKDLTLEELRDRVQFDTPLMMAKIGEKLDYEYVFYRPDPQDV